MLNMRKRKLTNIDKIQGYIVICLSIPCILLGCLLVTSVIKLFESFPIPSVLFGYILITLGLISFIYSLVIIILVNKQTK